MKHIRSYIITRMRALQQATQGVAYIEFALAAPLLLTLLLGSIEVTRFILIVQKVEKTSVTISDLVAQSTSATTSSLNNDMLAASQVMQPYGFGNAGYVIVSSVTQTGNYSTSNPAKVNWQYIGGGTMAQVSRIGTTGTTANLPQGFTLNDKDNVIVTEVYYRFTPMINSQILGAVDLYKASYFKPRLGALNKLTLG